VDIFSRPVYKHIVADSLEFCMQQKGLVIYAWVLMTNHLHLIAEARGESTLSDILRDFKRHTSRKIIETLQKDMKESRREWMLGRFAYAGKNDPKIKEYRFWQEGNDVQPLVSEYYLLQKLHYIHLNPVRAEFVNHAEEYKYSSAIDYCGGQGVLKIPKI